MKPTGFVLTLGVLLTQTLCCVRAQPFQEERVIVVHAQTVTTIGPYQCEGTQNGRAYKMALKVEALGDARRLIWGSPPTLFGLGLPYRGYLAVAIVSPSTSAVGVAMYAISAGHLTGVWARGDGTINVEHCSSTQGKAT